MTSQFLTGAMGVTESPEHDVGRQQAPRLPAEAKQLELNGDTYQIQVGTP